MECSNSSSSQYQDLFSMVTPPLIPPFTESFEFSSSSTSSSSNTTITTSNPLWYVHPSQPMQTSNLLDVVSDQTISDLTSLLLPGTITNVVATGNVHGEVEVAYDDSSSSTVASVVNNRDDNDTMINMLTPTESLNQQYTSTRSIITANAAQHASHHMINELFNNNSSRVFLQQPEALHYSSCINGEAAILPQASSSNSIIDNEAESSDSGDELAVNGGYNYEFIQLRAIEDEDLVCPICQFVAREPQQSECCGKVFCTVCINRLTRLRSYNFKCPNCRKEPVSLFNDKRSNRSISNLQVYCKRKRKGCTWTGLLSEVDNHLQTCLHQLIHCGNNCGKRIQRRLLTKHMRRSCPNRPFQCTDCKEEGQWRYITGSHVEKCLEKVVGCSNEGCKEKFPRRNLSHHLMSCPKRLMHCQYSDVGCTVTCTREEMAAHEQQYILQHLESAVKVARTLTTSSLAAHEDHLLQIAPVIIRIPNFSQLDRVHRTHPFLTSIKGYKMCLLLVKQASCVEFSFSLMAGSYDSSLTWPFHGKIILLLLNQKEDRNHYEMSTCLPVEMGVSRVVSHHHGDSISIGKIDGHLYTSSSSMENRGYLLNDVMSVKFTYESTRRPHKMRSMSKRKKSKHSSKHSNSVLD